jgi:hypothetical protein
MVSRSKISNCAGDGSKVCLRWFLGPVFTKKTKLTLVFILLIKITVTFFTSFKKSLLEKTWGADGYCGMMG